MTGLISRQCYLTLREHICNSTSRRPVLATLALAISGASCVKNQMSTPDAIVARQGNEVLSIDTVQVQTDTGAPGLCLYTVSGKKREPINKQVLLPGELMTALETSTGIEDVRSDVMAEVMRPVKIVTQGLLVGLAGRGLADISQQGFDADRFAKNLIKVQGLDAQLSERLVAKLTQAGFSFGPGNEAQVAAKALEDLRSRRISSREFIQRIQETLPAGSADPKVARFRDIVDWASSRSVTLAELKSKIYRPFAAEELDKLFKSLRSQLPEAAPAAAGQAANRGAQATVRKTAARLVDGSNAALGKFFNGFDTLCNLKSANMSVALISGTLCMTGALIAAQGVVGGFALLGKANEAGIDTSAIKSALAAPPAGQRADLKVSPQQFYAIEAGVGNYADRIVQDPDLASRPNCP